MAFAADSSRRGRIVGILLQHIGVRGSGITELFVEGVVAECAAHQLGHIGSFYIDPNDFRQCMNDARRAQVDGFIVMGRFRQDLVGDLVSLQRGGMPIVTVFHHPIHRTLVNIGADQVGIARTATEHLLERGCREILHLRMMEERLIGYRQALRAHGIIARPEWVYSRQESDLPHLSAASGEAAMEHVLREKIPFDGVVGGSDHQALGAIRGLLKAGVRVPQDVKVIGVDNAPACEVGAVSLTSIGIDMHLRGRLAVQTWMDVRRGQSVASMSLDPVLHVRESTGG